MLCFSSGSITTRKKTSYVIGVLDVYVPPKKSYTTPIPNTKITSMITGIGNWLKY